MSCNNRSLIAHGETNRNYIWPARGIQLARERRCKWPLKPTLDTLWRKQRRTGWKWCKVITPCPSLPKWCRREERWQYCVNIRTVNIAWCKEECRYCASFSLSFSAETKRAERQSPNVLSRLVRFRRMLEYGRSTRSSNCRVRKGPPLLTRAPPYKGAVLCKKALS